MASDPPAATAPEGVATKEDVAALRERIDELESRRQDPVSVLARHTGFSRRQIIGALAGAGILSGVGGYTAGTAQAMASDSDSDGDVGSPSTRVDLFADGIDMGEVVEFSHESVNSAVTIGNVTYVYYDSAVSGFTITIPAALETDGVVLRFIDQSGNAATNSVDITSTNWNIDGQGTVTIDASDTVFEIHADGGEWLSGIFVLTVDARLVKVGSEVQDANDNTILGQRVASGSTTLSSGAATIDTGVGVGNTATFYVALGPDTDDAEVAAAIEAPSGGNYTVHLEEVNTSVGNPSVFYDVVRVR